MIGPVSGTGRAMMASLQQAIQKGMPPEQAVQYVKSMATQGVAPLADLYAMMNQFQRLKQPQAQAPQTPPTIRDQLNALDHQQQMQQGAYQQPMNRGLGAIDAGLMEYPQFAGGGIVAFDDGGTARSSPRGIDFTKMTLEQLQILANSGDRNLSASAYQEYLRRTGYVDPRGLGQKVLGGVENFAERILSPATGRFPDNFEVNMVGGAPSYMKDETGQIRKGEVTAGIAGTPFYSSNQKAPSVPSTTPTPAPATPAVTPSQSAVPPPAGGSSPADFSAMLARAQTGVRQDQAPATLPVREAPPAREVPASARSAGGRDPFARLIQDERNRKFESVPDTFSADEMKRVQQAIGGLSKDKQDAVRMALAQAGFSMAAAASRSGRQRTTALGALAEGAMGGLQQYNATQRDLRQTERELNREMSALRRYQDEVARGERTAQRAFEEKRADNIANLTARSEQLALTREELAQKLKIAGMELEGRKSERADVNAARMMGYQINAIEARLRSAQEQEKQALMIPNPKEREQAITRIRSEIMRLNSMLEGLASGGGMPSTMGESTVTSSGW